jgi:hypothetical protein
MASRKNRSPEDGHASQATPTFLTALGRFVFSCVLVNRMRRSISTY